MYGLWRRTFTEVAAEYPDVRAETRYVDALAMGMVRAPHELSVIVTENLLGDILSDLGAGLIGGPAWPPRRTSTRADMAFTSRYTGVHLTSPERASPTPWRPS